MTATKYIQDITQCLDLCREWAEAELAAREGVITMTFTDYQTEVDTRLNRLQSVDINPLLLELAEHSKERIRAMCVSLSRIKLPIRVNPHTYEYADEIPMQYWNEPWAEAYNSTWRLAADFVMGIVQERGFDGFDDLFPSSSEHRTSSDNDGIDNRRLEALIREKIQNNTKEQSSCRQPLKRRGRKQRDKGTWIKDPSIKDIILADLHSKIDPFSNGSTADIVAVLAADNRIERIPYSEAKAEFPNIGAESGYNNQWSKYMKTKKIEHF